MDITSDIKLLGPPFILYAHGVHAANHSCSAPLHLLIYKTTILNCRAIRISFGCSYRAIFVILGDGRGDKAVEIILFFPAE